MRAFIIIASLLLTGITAPSQVPCVAAPAFMTFWAPLDDAAGSPVQDAANFPHKGADIGGPAVVNGLVVKSRQYDGNTQYTEFPDHPCINVIKLPNQPTANFTIDCWINVPAGADLTGVHTILDKRAYDLLGIKGYALYLYNGYLGFQMGDGGFSNWIAFQPSHLIAPGSGWHFVAVTVDRANPSGGTLYVDLASWTFNPTAHQGSLVNTAPLRIGARTVNGPPDAFFPGNIDEVEMHQAHLWATTLAAVYGAGSSGKCKVRAGNEECFNKVLSFSDGQSCMNYGFTVYNANATPRTLTYVFMALPAWNGSNSTPSNCNLNGPTQYLPPSGIITVPAHGNAYFGTIINRPAGTGWAAFKVVMTDTQTLQVTEGLAVVYVSNSDLNTTDCSPYQGPIAPAGVTGGMPILAGLNRFGTGSFRVTNTGPTAVSANFEMKVQDGTCTPDTTAVSLRMLPPGIPWTSYLMIGPGQTVTIPVSAAFRRRDAQRFYSVTLSTDASGVMTPINGLDLVDGYGDGLTLSAISPEAGAIDLRIVNARPFSPVFSFFTTQQGVFPNGWLFGLDLSLGEFQIEYSVATQGGAPFFLLADLDGQAAWSIGGLPPGIPFFGVGLALDALGTGILSSSPVGFVTE